ncbi:MULTISPECIES: hypothetical protein [Streptomyces]|uniref:hypothetical protein n=1 Tax=Streptomyces TaxID=1883 RepID=UPI0017AD758D|nr:MULTISPECIES: hypothetical protein [Streptomyces]MBB4161574.1 hypothetical protein [Streptomyces cinereoruber]NIH60870.1 hypothetical protein [Streptomyces cinereoruber]
MRGIDGGPDDGADGGRHGGPGGGPAFDGPGFDGFGGGDRLPAGRRRPRRAVRAAGAATVAGLAAFGLSLAACSTGGTGSRDEGAARTDEVAATAPTSAAPSGTPGPRSAERVDPIELLKADPKLSRQVKADLKPCAADSYPVDASYGNLTDAPAPDVVVNVMTCGDGIGIGTYVYRNLSDGYENVFAAEDAGVYSTIDRGDLIVTKQVYAKGDPVAYPSGEDVITYRWSGNRFTQHDWVHNDYSRSVGEGEGLEPAPSEPPAG